MKRKQFAVNLLKTVGIVAVFSLISLGLRRIGVGDSNILMTYLTGVLAAIILTKGYFCGFLSSVSFVLIFNFFFTDPVHTFLVSDPNYLLTFLIFLVISLIVGTLTSKLQKQLLELRRTQVQTANLYQISNGYLHLKDLDEIIRHGLGGLYQIQGRHSILYLEQTLQALAPPYTLPGRLPDTALIEQPTPARWCLQNGAPCGHGTAMYSKSDWLYLPVKINDKTLGVIGIYCDSEISPDEKIYIDTVISQMALAIQREILYQQQENSRIELEKEKLRNNLLRSVSHDLRTPLTGIAGSASFMLESFDSLDKKTILSLLSDISVDAAWLNNLVENLLNMTRIQDGKLLIKKENEVVDDIVSEAVRRVSKLQKQHTFSVSVPDDILLVPMDGKLIIQVLVNLLDNSFQHTRPDSAVELSIYRQEDRAVFDVSDNGGGIRPDLPGALFDSFVSAQNSPDSRRGIGLGLSICQAVVQAHGGTIEGFNNSRGGATFRFSLPLCQHSS